MLILFVLRTKPPLRTLSFMSFTGSRIGYNTSIWLLVSKNSVILYIKRLICRIFILATQIIRGAHIFNVRMTLAWHRFLRKTVTYSIFHAANHYIASILMFFIEDCKKFPGSVKHIKCMIGKTTELTEFPVKLYLTQVAQ